MRSSCSATTSAMVWLRRAALRTYAATCVSKATGIGRAAGSSAMPRTSSGLTSWATTGVAGGQQERAKRGGIVGALDRHGPAVHPGEREGDRRAAPRSRVVQDEPGPDGRLGRQPRLEAPRSGRRGGPRSATDRRWPPPGRSAGPPGVSTWIAPSVDAGGDRGLGRSRDRRSTERHGIEVEGELEAAALGRGPGRLGRAPAGRSRGAGDARRRHGPVVRDAVQGLGRLAGGLAGHRRQALDERAELVLAEEPDDRLAVVVAETGRLQVELDRQVAHDRGQVLAQEDLRRGARRACRAACPA